jgi:hypothetical protein
VTSTIEQPFHSGMGHNASSCVCYYYVPVSFLVDFLRRGGDQCEDVEYTSQKRGQEREYLRPHVLSSQGAIISESWRTRGMSHATAGELDPIDREIKSNDMLLNCS